MPPKKATRAAMRKKEPSLDVVDTPKLPLAEGAALSMNLKTTNKLGSAIVNFSTGTGNVTSDYNKKIKGYTSTVELYSKEPFALKPMVISSGFLKGRQVLVLEPDQPPDEGFPFLELPSEIRNMIYKCLFMKQDGGDITVRGNQLKHIYCFGPTSLCMLRTCRQVFNEAAGIYYGANNFVFDTTTAMFYYLTRIGSSAKFLRNIELDKVVNSTVMKATRLLAKCTGLVKVGIKTDGPNGYWRRSNNRSGREWVHLLHPLLVALQAQKNDREAVSKIFVCIGKGYKCDHTRTWFHDGMCTCWSAEEWNQDFKVALFKIIEDKEPPAPKKAKVSKSITSGQVVERNRPETRSSKLKNSKITSYMGVETAQGDFDEEAEIEAHKTDEVDEDFDVEDGYESPEL